MTSSRSSTRNAFKIAKKKVSNLINIEAEDGEISNELGQSSDESYQHRSVSEESHDTTVAKETRVRSTKYQCLQDFFDPAKHITTNSINLNKSAKEQCYRMTVTEQMTIEPLTKNTASTRSEFILESIDAIAEVEYQRDKTIVESKLQLEKNLAELRCRRRKTVFDAVRTHANEIESE